MKEFDQNELKTLEYGLPEEVLKYKMCGDFEGARKSISRWMDRPITEGLKKRLSLEKEMLDLLELEFPYTAEETVKLFFEKVPDFTREDLNRLDEEGLAEWIFLDGQKHYIHNILRNVLGNDKEIRKRAGITEEISEEEQNLSAAIAELKEKRGLKKRFRLRTSVALREECFQKGMYLKAHLPLPASLYQVSDVTVLNHSDCKVTIAPEDSLFRAICFEDVLDKNIPFFVEYEYTVHSVYHDFSEADRKQAEEGWKEDPDVGLYLEEQSPQIRFTLYLRDLAETIVGGEQDPLKAAWRIYDYITKHVKYSYMKEYFLIPQIPQYCAENLRGDCGVQSLLFITLCRICGIPAKWQSGLYANPGYVGPHDWAMFYVKPYGWLFADPSFGGEAFSQGNEERRRFYFGNLDPFRMVSNNAFAMPFDCPKKFRPIDPYDNQSGEIESDQRGFSSREIESKKCMVISC
ncbi:MAG: transglutaminase-like domain-containing protein [Candidatus Choladocola sp.]|nr:transglutaminase-like domain-containing protein [Candidatus Choladocola sp.]